MLFSSKRAWRAVATIGLTLGLVTAGCFTNAAQAGTFSREVETFSDPFSGSFECDGFAAHYVGHDHGKITTWFDANGNPVRQQGKIYALETDINDSTGASVEVRTQLNVHVDFLADVQSLTGIRNLSTEPGRGVVIQSVGRLVVRTSDGEILAVRGHADDIDRGGGFCEALSG
jgi:hypothetical protein